MVDREKVRELLDVRLQQRWARIRPADMNELTESVAAMWRALVVDAGVDVVLGLVADIGAATSSVVATEAVSEPPMVSWSDEDFEAGAPI